MEQENYENPEPTEIKDSPDLDITDIVGPYTVRIRRKASNLQSKIHEYEILVGMHNPTIQIFGASGYVFLGGHRNLFGFEKAYEAHEATKKEIADALKKAA